MRSNCSFVHHKSLKWQHGLAIGVILAAVALVAVLSIALAAANFTTMGWWNIPTGDTRAAALIAEARNLRAGVDMMTGRGISISSITFGTSGTTALFDPEYGGAESQPLIPEAMTSVSKGWVWKVDANGNPVVKLYNVGNNSNADYVAVLPNIEFHVCNQINMQLNNYNGNPWLSVPAATYSALTTPATSLDLSASNSGTQGWSEGCYATYEENWNSALSTYTPYVYIVTIRAQ